VIGWAGRNSFFVFVDGVDPSPARDQADIAVRTNQKNDVVFVRNPVGGVCSAIGGLSNGTFAQAVERRPFQITYSGSGLRAERQQCEVRPTKQVEKANPP